MKMPYNYSNETIFGIHNDAERYGWMSFNLFIVTTSFIGDSLILVGSIKYNAFALHEAIVAIIQHIAVCDLLLSLMILQRTIVLVDGTDRLIGTGLCYIKAYLGAFTMSASVFLVCGMTASKFVLLKYPLRTGYVTSGHAHKLCILLWTVSLYFPLTFLLTDRRDVAFTYRQYDCAYNFSSAAWKWLKPVSSLLLGLLPNLAIVITTVMLLVEARKVARGAQSGLKWRGVMTVVLTALIYTISIVPLTVYYLAEPYIKEIPGKPGKFYTVFFSISMAFLNLNTVSNFFIYCLTVKTFRSFLRDKIGGALPCFTSGDIQQRGIPSDNMPGIRRDNRTTRNNIAGTRGKAR